jgi:hypothetical protein
MHELTWWVAVGLLAVSGCGGGSGEFWPRAEDAGADGGERPLSPNAPAPSQSNAGSGDPGLPAGSGGGGGSGDLDASVAEPLPPNFELECSDAPDEDVPADPLAAWGAERDAHGALGYAATFRVAGETYRVHGDGLSSVSAPFTLNTGSIGSGLVSFDDVEVEDVEERGRIELYAGGAQQGELHASAGTLELPLKSVVVEAGVIEAAIDLTPEQVGNTEHYEASATASNLALNDVTQAYLYPEGTSGLDQRIEWMPSDAVVLREASSMTLYEDDVGSLEPAMGEALELDYDAFGLAGDFTAGSVESDEVDVRGRPLAIFGRDVVIRADTSSVESVGRFRLTQAMNQGGLVLPAEVQVVPEAPEVWVKPNATRVVRFHYRERSYRGDAVLAKIEVGGRANDLLELQTGFPDTLTGEIIDAIVDTGWAAPLLGIAALPTVSIVFVIDVFDCIFGGCLDLPAPLDPFPQWIDAGAIGTMEVRVKGDLSTGTYQTSLTFVGRNYCPVTVPLIVHIGEEPTATDGGLGGAGDASAIDGG